MLEIITIAYLHLFELWKLQKNSRKEIVEAEIRKKIQNIATQFILKKP